MTINNYLTYYESTPKALVSSKTGKWYATLRTFNAYDNGGVVYTFGSSGFSWIRPSADAQTRLIGHEPLIDENGYLLAANWLMNGTEILFNIGGAYLDSHVSVYCSAVVLDKNLIFASRYDGGGDFVFNWSIDNRITSVVTGSAINVITDKLHPVTWESFTWNGTNWVSADPTWNGAWVYPNRTGKPTHTTTDALIDGLTIKFEELSNLGFRAGDWYSQVICLGVHKTNVNNVQMSSSAYFMPTELITTDETHTIKATAPYNAIVKKSSRGGSTPDATFKWIDPDVAPMQIQIAGYPSLATIRTDIEVAPALNEVLVNSSNGSLICNSADAGKSLPVKEYLIVKGDENRAFATPTPFAGIHNTVVLLRHDVGVIDDGSGNVTQWSDQSGYSNHTIAPAGQSPTLDQSLLVAGKPSIKFNTNYRRLALPSSNPVDFSQGFTFVARVYRLNANRSRQVIFEMRNEGTLQNSHVILGFNGSAFSLYHAPFTGGSAEPSCPDATYNTWKTYLATFDPNTNKLVLRINGVTGYSGTALWGNFGRFFGSLRPQVIGSNASVNSDWTLTGNMSFFGAYNNYLTVKECEVVEAGILAIS